MMCVRRVSVIVILFVAYLQNASLGNQPTNADRLTELFFTVTDSILQRHVDPPVRQQMLLSAVKAICDNSEMGFSPDLSREISALTERDEIQKFLAKQLLSSSIASKRPAIVFEQMFVRGLLKDAGDFVPGNESRVAKQLRENLYVGIGIRLSSNQGVATIIDPFPRGPAHRAGAKNRDQILMVDGVPTEGKKLHEVVQMLRGERGTKVSIIVRQAGEEKKRKLDMVRDVVPIDTVEGVARDEESGDWIFRIDAKLPIAYLRVKEIKGSTVHELKKVASQLHAEKFEALILDLTSSSGNDVRHAGMFADALLGNATIGLVQERGRVRQFESDDDNLFADWPIVVLAGPGTTGVAEWIAAALADNKRATVIGGPTMGSGFVRSFISLPNEIGEIVIPTGILCRVNGESLYDKSHPLVAHRLTRVVPRRESTNAGVKPNKTAPLNGGPKNTALKEAIALVRAALDNADE